jgi:hypothetical protein
MVEGDPHDVGELVVESVHVGVVDHIPGDEEVGEI